MFEGCNIHLSPIDGKRLCSFSQKICKQHRLNGFAFCIRHILEDTNAPFKQCQYTMKSNGEKCFNPVKVSSEQIYCNSHLQVLGLLPKTIPKKIIKKSHDTIPMSSSKNSNVKNAKNQLMKKLKNQKLQKKRRNQLLMLNRKMKTSTAAKVNERKTTTEENEDNGNNKFWYDTVAETLKKTEKNIEKWRSKKLDEQVECYREMKMKYKKEMDDVHVVRSDVQECNKELDITNSYQSSLLITPERTYHNDLHVDNIATQERKALNKLRHQYSQLKQSISSKKSHLSYSVLSKLIESVKKDPLETANVINVSNNPHTATILKDQKEICGYSIPCCIVNKKSRCNNSVVPYTKYCKKHILNDEEQLIYFKPAPPYVKPSTYINGVTYTFLCNDAQKQNTKKKVEPNANKTKKHSRTSSSNKKSKRNKSDISDQSSLNESSDFNDRTNSDESSASSATEEDETPEEAFHLPAGSIRSYSPVNVADEDSLSTFQNRNVDFEDDDVELIRCGGSKPFSFEANNAMSRDLSSPTLNQLSSREDLIKTIADELFGLKVDEGSEMKELVSYDDCNYLIQGRLSDVRSKEEQSYDRFILKIKHSGEPNEISKLIPDVMNFCYKRCHKDFLLPKPISIMNSENMLTQSYEIPLSNNITVENEIDLNTIVADNLRVVDKEIFNVHHLVSLTVYIPGDILCNVMLTKSLSCQIGENAARLDAVLKDYHCDSEETLRSNWIWDLAAHSDILRIPYVSSIDCHELRTKIEDILKSHDEFTLPKLKNIEKQWIHSDINEQNIIVREDKIIGFIDFGDTIYSYRVVDVATALSYISILAKDKCLIYIAEFMRGYQSHSKLSCAELDVIFPIMMKRFAQSNCLGEYQYKYVDPGNEYLLVSCREAVQLIDFFNKEENKTAFHELLKLQS